MSNFTIDAKGQFYVHGKPVDVFYASNVMTFSGFVGTDYDNLVDAFDKSFRSSRIPVLVLEGGADIHPSIYGEENTHSYVYGDKPSLRDLWEMRAITIADEWRVPIFGICRGHQLLAATRGGKLWQDIGAEAGAFMHPSQHYVQCDGVLQLIGNKTKRRVVNSLHHQAVRVVPEGAEVIARSDDGLIEALWYPSSSSAAAAFTVQWHPELMRDYTLFADAIALMHELV